MIFLLLASSAGPLSDSSVMCIVSVPRWTAYREFQIFPFCETTITCAPFRALHPATFRRIGAVLLTISYFPQSEKTRVLTVQFLN